jgi:Putative Ig domain
MAGMSPRNSKLSATQKRSQFWFSHSAALACLLVVPVCPVFLIRAQAQSEQQSDNKASSKPDAAQLVIDTVSFPGTYARGRYSVQLQQHGGTPPFHWKVEHGDLPRGLILEDDGSLHGSPQTTGEYHLTISVTDSSKPPQAVQRDYVLKVVPAFTLTWKTPAHVAGNRIEGSVEVSNGTPQDFDLTFIVLAVNETGRATAIGYQRFPLKKGTSEFEIPFGDTVPHGAYVVHVDAVGEVADENLIYRERLQTPSPLQVAAGP